MRKTAGTLIQFTIEVECGLFFLFVNIIDFYFNSILLYKISSSTGTVTFSAISLQSKCFWFYTAELRKDAERCLNRTDESEIRFLVTSSIRELKI